MSILFLFESGGAAATGGFASPVTIHTLGRLGGVSAAPGTPGAVFAQHYTSQGNDAMYLRQATASQEIMLGPFVDATDGSTAETLLSIANTDIKLWKEGGTVEANKNSGGATHIASGRYYTVLDATDTDTVGKLEVNVHVAGALPVRRVFMVLEEAIWDALFAPSAAGYQVPIWSSAGATVNLSGTTVNLANTVTTLTNLPSIPANWITSAGITDGAFTAAKFAASSLNGKGDWNIGKTGYSLTAVTGLGNQTANITGTVSGNSTHTAADVWTSGTRTLTAFGFSVTASSIGVGAITSTSFAAGAIDNAAMSIDGSELTAIPWNAAWDAQVESEVADALTAFTWTSITIGTVNLIGGSGIQETSFANGCITDQKIMDGAFTAAKFAASSLNGKGDWNIGKTGYTISGTLTTLDALDAAQDSQHSTTQSAVSSGVSSILSKLLKYVQLMFRKDAAIATDNATELTAINANGGSGAGSVDNTTDSQQAIADNAGGGGGGSGYLATGTVASTTGTTTTLDAGSVATADYYNDAKLVITAGTGAGQERLITAYSSGRVATHLAWTTNPDNASTYEIRVARASVAVAGSGTGARSVTVTVDDGTDPVQSAIVRFTKGAESYTNTTNASGVCTFSLDDGTWAVTISRSGYSFTPTTLVVDGTETPTYSMSIVVVAPASDPDQTTGYFTVRNSSLVGQSGVTVYFRMTDDPGGSGDMFSREWFTAVSGALGATTVTLAKGATYEMRVAGMKECLEFTVPANAGDTYEIPDSVSDR